MTLPLVSAEFYVGTEPDLQFAQGSGLGVCKFRVKAATRVRQDDGSFKDGKTLWATAIVWSSNNKPFAENTYESIRKGDTVILSGPIYTRTYTQNGVDKFVVEIDVRELGPLLHFRSTPHGASSGGSSGGRTASKASSDTSTQPDADSPAEAPTEDGDPPF